MRAERATFNSALRIVGADIIRPLIARQRQSGTPKSIAQQYFLGRG